MHIVRILPGLLFSRENSPSSLIFSSQERINHLNYVARCLPSIFPSTDTSTHTWKLYKIDHAQVWGATDYTVF